MLLSNLPPDLEQAGGCISTTIYKQSIDPKHCCMPHGGGGTGDQFDCLFVLSDELQQLIMPICNLLYFKAKNHDCQLYNSKSIRNNASLILSYKCQNGLIFIKWVVGPQHFVCLYISHLVFTETSRNPGADSISPPLPVPGVSRVMVLADKHGKEFIQHQTSSACT